VASEAPHAKPPARFGEAEQIGVGKLVYGGYCSVCHGDSAVAAGVLPDLRWSPMLGSADGWRKVVLDGTRQKQGMVSFAQVLTPELAELVRAFVVSRANDSYQDPKAPPARRTRRARKRRLQRRVARARRMRRPQGRRRLNPPRRPLLSRPRLRQRPQRAATRVSLAARSKVSWSRTCKLRSTPAMRPRSPRL
jgi:hypothetical protein